MFCTWRVSNHHLKFKWDEWRLGRCYVGSRGVLSLGRGLWALLDEAGVTSFSHLCPASRGH